MSLNGEGIWGGSCLELGTCSSGIKQTLVSSFDILKYGHPKFWAMITMALSLNIMQIPPEGHRKNNVPAHILSILPPKYMQSLTLSSLLPNWHLRSRPHHTTASWLVFLFLFSCPNSSWPDPLKRSVWYVTLCSTSFNGPEFIQNKIQTNLHPLQFLVFTLPNLQALLCPRFFVLAILCNA